MALAGCGDDDGDTGSAADAAADFDAAGQPDAAGDPDAAPPPQGEALASILSGTFDELPAYEEIRDVRGRVQLIRTAAGDTRVELQAIGLEASTAYPVHVHNQPCDLGDAGTHYLIDPGAAPGETNEIWVGFTSDGAGIGHASVTVEHAARGEALAVVIHDPNAGNAKMACADLVADDAGDVVSAGEFASFAAAETIDDTIGGTVALIAREESTAVIATWTGLTDTETYTSHVHAQPCEVLEAAGHYKRDPTVGGAVEENELWLTIADYADGTATQTVVFEGHVARADAQAVVVHRNGAKVACANLVRSSYPALEAGGNASLFDAAIERGYTALTAAATTRRSLDGLTWVELQVSGLAESTEYGAHVHALPCDESDGGGHYKIDTSVEGAVEENEIWVGFTTDAEGGASSTALVEHIARPEAQSVVIHDVDDGARLACIDLD